MACSCHMTGACQHGGTHLRQICYSGRFGDLKLMGEDDGSYSAQGRTPQSKIALPQSELQVIEPGGYRSLSVPYMTPQEVQARAKERAKEREKRFKQRVNLMAKLADAKKKKEAKLADAKEEEEVKLADAKQKEEAKLADTKQKEEAKLADAKKEEAKLADAKEEEEAKLADAEKKEDANLADTKKEEEAKLADAKQKEEAKLADAKKKEEAKLADAKEEEKAKLADAEKKEEATLADAKEEEKAKLADAEKKEEANLADAKKKEEAKLADAKEEEEAKLAEAKEEEEVKLADAMKKEQAKLADAKKKTEAKLARTKKKEEAMLAYAKKKEEARLADAKKTKAEIMSELDRLEDDRNPDLLQPRLTWEDKVVNILQMIRHQEVTEYNHKLGEPAHTHFFCGFNIAFFDLDKESDAMPWKPIDQIPSPRASSLADSVNVVAIKVAESDRDYPISVFGTVLARDEYDYRCVYLFKRGRDDPQVITSKDDTLTLMGPYRALAVTDHMYFEFHLKVKGDGDVNEDFSKGVLVHSAVCHSEEKIMTKYLPSCLSTVKLVYTPVPCAVEASFTVSMLKGPSDFIGKVTAWTTGNEENKIVVYNKKVAGVGRGGSVVHGLVSVPEDEELVIRVSVFEHCEHEQGKCFQLTLGLGINEQIAKQESHELQVKISWRGVMNRRRPNMWGRVGDTLVLL